MSFRSIEIGERIRDARKAANMSQTELADRLNKSLRTIQKYESGDILPPLDVIDAIAEVLDTTTAHFIGYGNKEIHLDSFSDVAAFLYELNKKSSLRFEIGVKYHSSHGKWECSICFDGDDPNAELNGEMCVFLKRFRDAREDVETYWADWNFFDSWIEHQLIDYGDYKLRDKEIEVLSLQERKRRRYEWEDMMEKKEKKAAEERAKKMEELYGKRNSNSDK